MKSPLLMRPLFADKPRPGTADFDDLAAVAKALAHPSRLQMLALMHRRGQMTGAQLAPLLGLSQPTISHHMAILRDAELIRSTKTGKETLCEIDAEAMARVSTLIHPRMLP